MKHKIKATLLGLLLVGIGVTWTTVYFLTQTDANSDYVCYTTSGDCSECLWGPWDTETHSRECRASGLQAIHWGNTRTGCSKADEEFGYDGGVYRYGIEVVGSGSTVCETKTQTDTAKPTCNTKEEDGKFYLQCVANGPAACIDYTEWTEIPYALPAESKILGIGTESGMYEGCVIPEKPE